MKSTAELVTNNQNEKTFKDMDFKEKVKFMQASITIEPVIILYLLATTIAGPAVENLPLEMACRVNAGYNETICMSILNGTHKQLGFVNQTSHVQDFVSDMSSWCYPVEKVVPVILLLFIGTFSDKHKIRKPFILIPIFGEVCSAICCIFCTIFADKWSVDIEGVSQTIIPSLFGAYIVLVMAAFSYIIDISTPDMLAVRIAMLELIVCICDIFGSIFSGLFYKATGALPSLVFALVLYLTAFILGIFTIKEPKQPTNESFGSLVTDLFNPQHVVETFKLFTKSKGQKFLNIIFIMFIYFLTTVEHGEGNVFLYFANLAYGWTPTTKTYYSAASTLIIAIGLAVGVPLLSKVFKLSDLLIIAVSFFNKIISNTINILVKSTCGLYMGLVAGIFSGISSVGIRSQSARYVSEEDMGKTQSLLAIVGAIGNSIAVEIYHQGIYIRTKDTFPQAFFLVTIVVYAVGIPMLLWKHIEEKKNPPVVETINSEKGTELQNTKI